MAKTIELNEKNFSEEVIQSNVPVLVDFWAPWCAPCKIVAPILEEISTEFDGTIKVGKLNTDENIDISTKYNIRGIPTLGIFKNGEMVDAIVGAVPKGMIVEKLKYFVNGNR